MMNPEMMKLAMEQMMQAMMANAGNIDPGMMRMAQQQFNNMSPADLERAKQEMSRMDPATMAAQAKTAQEQVSAQQKYILSGSQQLKAEGNRLHTAGDFAAAAERYERARANLVDFTSSEAAALRRACVLNLGSCYLQLGRYHDALDMCTSILAEDPNNLKALYRRGQAHSGLQQHSAAVADLEAALVQAGGDDTQAAPIREKLSAARTQLAAAPLQKQSPAEEEEDGVVEEVEVERPAAANTSSSRAAEELVIEEVDCMGGSAAPAARSSAGASTSSTTARGGGGSSTAAARASQPSPAAAAASSGAGPGAGFMGMGVEQMQQMQEMMQKNPDMMKQATEMMRNMDPKQLAAMGEQMGVPMPPGMLDPAGRSAWEPSLAGLDPAAMQDMAALAAKMQAGGATPDMAAAQKMMSENPSMIKASMDMLRNMPKEQLQAALSASGQLPPGMTADQALQAAEMLRSMPPGLVENMTATMAAGGGGTSSSSMGATATTSASAGAATRASPPAAAAGAGAGAVAAAPAASAAAGADGLPPGMPPGMMTPEMMQMAMSMMSNMTPEDMAAMTQMAAAAQGADGGMDPTQMLGAIKPDMVARMLGAVRNMDDKSLSQMLVGSGMSQDKAEGMVQQLKGNPRLIDWLIRIATALFALVQWLLLAKQRLVQQPLLLAGLVLLVVAVLLRLLGIM